MRARAGVPYSWTLGLLLALAALSADGRPETLLEARFDAPEVDGARWQVTRQHDFRESVIDVVDGRLRLRADTLGTRDDTVKFHGLRTRESIDLSGGAEIEWELDWNNQANGCYLTAGVYLCPVATDENPRDEGEWLKFEYIGVPPGRNARALIAMRSAGRLRQFYTEGWPAEQRVGRAIGRQRVRLVLTPGRLEAWENGARLFATDEHVPHLERAYLYLQMSSHSNYRAREIFFDDVVVRTVDGIPPR